MLSTWLFTKLKGKCVGVDSLGNQYFKERSLRTTRLKRPARRWVIYHGTPEASKVPAVWHGWLHGTTDEIPDTKTPPHTWEKSHLPNLTGTIHAYQPHAQKPASIENLSYYQRWESSRLPNKTSKK